MTAIPKSFVAFDLETTGFAPPCKIIEIGAVKVVDGKITEKFQTLVDPKCAIPAPIISLTGIDNQMVAGAPCIDKVLPEFQAFAGDLPLAAHNASFDMKFINYESVRLGCVKNHKVIDTLSIARRQYPELKNHKLGTVARHLGIESEMEHRGLYDAMAVAMILLKL